MQRKLATGGTAAEVEEVNGVMLAARNLGEVLKRYEKVVIPEMNLGQLAHVIRGRYLVDAISYNQVRGLPFTAVELESMLEEVVKNA